MLRWTTLLGCALSLACAWTTTTRVPYADEQTEGVRVYDPKPLLLVTTQQTSVVFVPDFERGYAIRFRAFLAKNNFSLRTEDGALTALSSSLDSASLLSLLQTVGQEALKQTGEFAALGSNVTGTIPGREGLYEFEFDEKGRFTGLRPISIRAPDRDR